MARPCPSWTCGISTQSTNATVGAIIGTACAPEYEKREQAEATLSDADRFGPFESLIRSAAESDDRETNYRLRRVLDRLSDYSGPAIGNFDELVLKNGETIRGDAGNFGFQVELLGNVVRLNRENLRQIVAADSTENVVQARPLKNRSFNQPFPTFYKDQDKLVSFETVQGGESTPLSENAYDLFAFEGLKFQTEDAGYVCTALVSL